MIFAARPTFTQFLEESWYLFAGLIAVVSLLVWLVMWLRTRLHDDTDRPMTTGQLLKQFQDSLREGELSEEEYRSIKGRLLFQDQSVTKVTDGLGLQDFKTDMHESTISSETNTLAENQTHQEKDEELSNSTQTSKREIKEKEEND